MLRTDIGGYVSPVGCRSLAVGLSCWLFAVAGGGSWWWWTVSAVSFVADYAWRSPHTAVVDRCVAAVAACITLPRAHPGAVIVAALCAVASRSAATTAHWVVAHTCWHVAAAACVASAAPLPEAM
jgi:hypothetical protein